MAFAGVNPVDWKIREGWLKKRLKTVFPAILGWDVSGVVSAVGRDVKHFKEGDLVFAYCRKPVVQWGTFAEYVTVEASHVAPKPKNISFAEAASIPLVALTAWQALFEVAKLESLQTILIHAGAGGVGSLAIQLAKEAGAKVYTTASSANHDYVKKLGADVAIDYKETNFVKEMKNLEKSGVDLVLDAVGDPIFEESLAVVKRGGWLVSIAKMFIEDSIGKEQGIRTCFVFVRPDGEELHKIGNLMESGSIQPPYITEYPLQEAAEALEAQRSGHTRGKIVLKVS